MGKFTEAAKKQKDRMKKMNRKQMKMSFPPLSSFKKKNLRVSSSL